MTQICFEKIPKVDIDPEGEFKYILVKVQHENNQESESCDSYNDCSLTIVRGYKRCNYHSDIFEEVQLQIKPYRGEPMGGGKISHNVDTKKIHIYGVSQGYGKADHELAAKLVREAYPSYEVTTGQE